MPVSEQYTSWAEDSGYRLAACPEGLSAGQRGDLAREMAGSPPSDIHPQLWAALKRGHERGKRLSNSERPSPEQCQQLLEASMERIGNLVESRSGRAGD